jgi:hypothetical protein
MGRRLGSKNKSKDGSADTPSNKKASKKARTASSAEVIEVIPNSENIENWNEPLVKELLRLRLEKHKEDFQRNKSNAQISVLWSKIANEISIIQCGRLCFYILVIRKEFTTTLVNLRI